MLKPLRPLYSAETYLGWIYTLLGAGIAFFLLPPTILVLAPRMTLSWRLAGLFLGIAFVAAIAFPRLTRQACVGLANTLLRTKLPAPTVLPQIRWRHWPRTAVWLLVHSVVGSVIVLITGFLLLIAAIFPLVWLADSREVQYFGAPVAVGTGWQLWWSPLVALASVMTMVYLWAGAGALLRLLASPLLGHSPAERMTVLEEKLNTLSQRNRLAQELHDSIGHTLTTSTIQAAVAGELLDSDPETARRALLNIEELSRTALDDLDYVLGVLREDKAATSPERNLGDALALVERVQHSGAEVKAEIRGDIARVPAVLSREAYRIVQEGLTNALRHAKEAPITVNLMIGDEWLAVEITNPITTRSTADSPKRQGHGLAGIAERVQLLGGQFSSGFVPDGYDPTLGEICWQLAVRLPLRSEV